MGIGALIGGSLLGGALSARSSDKAADAHVEAADRSAAVNKYMFDRSVKLTEPQRHAGNNALAAMQGMAGIGDMPSFGSAGNRLSVHNNDGAWEVQNNFGKVIRSFDKKRGAQRMMDRRRFSFEQDPGYQFRLDEGTKAMERAAAARGLRLSGATMKGIGDYASGLASQEYGNAFNRLASISGTGQTATNQQIGAGQNYAAGASNAFLNAGNARASGYTNTANAFNNTLGDVGGLYMMNQLGAFA
ncbi:hypothetical protein Q5Y75_05655 [Ruegeria sp. 2205SS24-7]|uniref:hypothetical protein n=1 Tax=Ruegeria discodermiae TaxID=3064389 RepID=UPI0027416302|nr:hypothetical protein [Ruegeria sp. 2205SS24-7]MDP5216696.1 hypothetical protein [Ruegeria sp. 2205SS24-7]